VQTATAPASVVSALRGRAASLRVDRGAARGLPVGSWDSGGLEKGATVIPIRERTRCARATGSFCARAGAGGSVRQPARFGAVPRGPGLASFPQEAGRHAERTLASAGYPELASPLEHSNVEAPPPFGRRVRGPQAASEGDPGASHELPPGRLTSRRFRMSSLLWDGRGRAWARCPSSPTTRRPPTGSSLRRSGSWAGCKRCWGPRPHTVR